MEVAPRQEPEAVANPAATPEAQATPTQQAPPTTATGAAPVENAPAGAPAEGQKSAAADFKVAHNDLIAYLYQSHGEAYDTNVKLLEEKTSVKREQMAYGAMALFASYLVFGALAQFVCNLAGFAYPAYASVKAIRTSNKDDDTQWLIYWTVFAAFALVDFFAEAIFQVFPLYFVAKLTFLIYLYLPQTMGAKALYTNHIDPLVTFIDARMAEKKQQ